MKVRWEYLLLLVRLLLLNNSQTTWVMWKHLKIFSDKSDMKLYTWHLLKNPRMYEYVNIAIILQVVKCSWMNKAAHKWAVTLHTREQQYWSECSSFRVAGLNISSQSNCIRCLFLEIEKSWAWVLVVQSKMQTKGRQAGNMRGKRGNKRAGEYFLLVISLSVLHSPFLSTVYFVVKCWNEDNIWAEPPVEHHDVQTNPDAISVSQSSKRSAGFLLLWYQSIFWYFAMFQPCFFSVSRSEKQHVYQGVKFKMWLH